MRLTRREQKSTYTNHVFNDLLDSKSEYKRNEKYRVYCLREGPPWIKHCQVVGPLTRFDRRDSTIHPIGHGNDW